MKMKKRYIFMILIMAMLMLAATREQAQNQAKAIHDWNDWDTFQLEELDSTGYTIYLSKAKTDSGLVNSKLFFNYDRMLVQHTVIDTATGEDSLAYTVEYWAGEDSSNLFYVCTLAWWADTLASVTVAIDSSDVYYSTSIDSHAVALGLLYGQLKWRCTTGHKIWEPDVQAGFVMRGRNKDTY